MMKMLAGPLVAGVLLLGTATVVEAQDAQTTPVDDATTSADNSDDDDGSSKVGLLGLLGLAGLAGLLKRNDHHDNPTQYQQTRPQA